MIGVILFFGAIIGGIAFLVWLAWHLWHGDYSGDWM